VAILINKNLCYDPLDLSPFLHSTWKIQEVKLDLLSSSFAIINIYTSPIALRLLKYVRLYLTLATLLIIFLS